MAKPLLGQQHQCGYGWEMPPSLLGASLVQQMRPGGDAVVLHQRWISPAGISNPPSHKMIFKKKRYFCSRVALSLLHGVPCEYK